MPALALLHRQQARKRLVLSYLFLRVPFVSLPVLSSRRSRRINWPRRCRATCPSTLIIRPEPKPRKRGNAAAQGWQQHRAMRLHHRCPSRSTEGRAARGRPV